MNPEAKARQNIDAQLAACGFSTMNDEYVQVLGKFSAIPDEFNYSSQCRLLGNELEQFRSLSDTLDDEGKGFE
jgi:hypothetical protein